MIRIGIIGAGGISHAHVNACRQLSGRLSVTAVCDADKQATTRLRAAFGLEVRTFTSYRDLLAAGECDAVVVCLPHDLHLEVALACLDAGLPVLVEKPLVTSLSALRELRVHARKTGGIVMSGQTRRFGAPSIRARRWIEEGNLGNLETFEICSFSNIEAYLAGRTDHWILDGHRAGGGVLMSMAIHRIDWVRFMTGENFTRVYAIGRWNQRMLRNDAEGTCIGCLETGSGAQGTLNASMTLRRSPHMEIVSLFGSLGSVREDQAGLRVACAAGANFKDWGTQFEGWEQVSSSAPDHLHDDAHVNQLVAFAQSIEARVPPPCDVDDNFNTLATVFAIYESMRTGAAVDVPSA